MNPEVIKSSYDRESFKKFIKEFIPDFTEDSRPLRLDHANNIASAQKLGNSTDLELSVYELEHTGSSGKRIGLALDAFKLMKNTGVYNALIAFHSKDTDTWRLSLMTSNQELKNGKVISAFSNPRRFSYVLGKSSKTATPHKFLISKGKVSNFEDLINRFSVEIVNHEFYKEIAKLYDDLVGVDETPGIIKYPLKGEASHQFAVRLIGRIVFCWFLREKNSPAGVPLIGKSILSRHASNQNDYYHTILAPLFFEVLNKQVDKRSERFQQEDFGKVPYLNGGLFYPQPDDYYKYDNVTFRSISGIVGVPDDWLRKLFDLLELYHFTVDENTSVDVDLSIDPEMLGRIFENLLARINPETGESVRKSTGSFYTPREIVEYMVDESLLQYLKTSVDVPEEMLKVLITYDLADDKEHEILEDHKKAIVKALSNLKILDPACGSGAFPIGMLQKIVFVLQRVDPEARLWLDEQTKGVPELRRQLLSQSLDYIRKLYTIRKCIFGVDIQPIATEISRLRCFLTLIVDENIDDQSENRGVRVLPNLDFKFVTANSLKKAPGVSDDKPMLLDTFEEELESIVSEYFSAEGLEKAELSHKLRDAIDRKVDENIKFVLNNTGLIKDKRYEDVYNIKNQKVNSALMDEAEAWKSYRNIFNHQLIDFFETRYIFPSVTDGFDIVIANPPYGAKISPIDRKKIFAGMTDRTRKLNPNSAGLFIDVALDRFLSKTGCLTYIVPKSLLYSEKWQLNVNRIIDNTLTLVDVEKAFEDVLLEQVVFVYSSIEKTSSYRAQKFLNENFTRSTYIEKVLAKELRAWICDVSEADVSIVKKFSSNKTFADVSKTKRGIGIQKYLKPAGEVAVIGGKNIARYSVSGEKGFVDETFLKQHKDKIDFLSKPKLVTQDLIAHIQNPAPHIKLTSAIDAKGSFLGLDTVQNTILTDDRYSLELLCGLLNSSFINWYVYKFIYCSAIRTMHLDNYYIGKIPLPEYNADINIKIEELVKELEDEANDDVIRKIDGMIYLLYGLTADEIAIIESSAKVKNEMRQV